VHNHTIRILSIFGIIKLSTPTMLFPSFKKPKKLKKTKEDRQEERAELERIQKQMGAAGGQGRGDSYKDALRKLEQETLAFEDKVAESDHVLHASELVEKLALLQNKLEELRGESLKVEDQLESQKTASVIGRIQEKVSGISEYLLSGSEQAGMTPSGFTVYTGASEEDTSIIPRASSESQYSARAGDPAVEKGDGVSSAPLLSIPRSSPVGSVARELVCNVPPVKHLLPPPRSGRSSVISFDVATIASSNSSNP
jgi:hypothetical protein